ncbi:MAG: cation transporter dimerization domain-containing protein, partial [Chloroflexota bacterium]
LAVLLAAVGVWLGFPLADPIIGFLIGIAIVFVTWDASVAVFYRLMDAVEPELIDKAEAIATKQTGIQETRRIRMRWVGHELHAEVTIAVEPTLTVEQSHAIAEQLRHALFHGIDFLAQIVVHTDPWSAEPGHFHAETMHHERVPEPIGV